MAQNSPCAPLWNALVRISLFRKSLWSQRAKKTLWVPISGVIHSLEVLHFLFTKGRMVPVIVQEQCFWHCLSQLGGIWSHSQVNDRLRDKEISDAGVLERVPCFWHPHWSPAIWSLNSQEPVYPAKQKFAWVCFPHALHMYGIKPTLKSSQTYISPEIWADKSCLFLVTKYRN